MSLAQVPTSSSSPRAAVVRGVILAALLVATAVVGRVLTPEYLKPGLAQRLVGASTGLIVVLYANVVPKSLTPLVRMRISPVIEQAMRRFAGVSLVLGGVGYLLAWILLPIDWANLVAGSILALTLLAAVTRYAWGMSRDRP